MKLHVTNCYCDSCISATTDTLI